MADFLKWLEALGSAATAVAVFLAWAQIKSNKRQMQTQFEDSLNREYRGIAESIPLKAFYREVTLEEAEMEQALPHFFRYFDLSNSQAFFRQKNRVGIDTWNEWKAGMKSNFALPSFDTAWKRLANKIDNRFAELRELRDKDFIVDPRVWNKR